MGVDVPGLIAERSSTSFSNSIGRSVVFTFCGPAGLIEGGSNQKISLVVDIDGITKVADLKTLLQRELDIDDGIDIVLKESGKGGKRIKTTIKLK